MIENIQICPFHCARVKAIRHAGRRENPGYSVLCPGIALFGACLLELGIDRGMLFLPAVWGLKE